MSVGYYAQEHEGIVAGRSLLEHMREASPAGDGALRNLLGMFGLSGDKVFQDAGTLSGGEKTKLALAQLVAGRHNVLLLDEPTNNLDPMSRTATGEALAAWPGTMIVVSHDVEFVRALAPDRVLLMPDGTLDYFDDEMLELRRARLPVFVVGAAVGDDVDACLIGFGTQCSIEPLRFAAFLSKQNHTYELACRTSVLIVHRLRRPARRRRALRRHEREGRSRASSRVAVAPRSRGRADHRRLRLVRGTGRDHVRRRRPRRVRGDALRRRVSRRDPARLPGGTRHRGRPAGLIGHASTLAP